MGEPGDPRSRGPSRVLVAIAAVVLLTTASCSFSVLRPPAVVLVDADQPARVRIGDRAERFPAAYHAYFPEEIVVHPGDVVNFQVAFTGEPHTVTLGTLVDDAARALSNVDDEATAHDVAAIPQIRALPALLHESPDDALPRVNQSAARPCFLDDAAPPLGGDGPAPPCPAVPQPDFTGRQRFYSSGWLAEGDVFSVRFSARIKPGTYHLVSLAAPGVMRGRVVVADPPRPRPRAYDVKRAGREQMSRLAVTLEDAAKQAAEAPPSRPIGGVFSADAANAQITAFAPRDLRTQTGRPVTWTLQGLHSIAFNHSQDAADGILVERDGAVSLNEAAWRPAGSPELPPGAWRRVPPPGTAPLSIDAGSWDGRGFLNSGVLAAFLRPATFTITFAASGRYDYRCLVHEKMRGRVLVT